jgi:hypothetical protein
VKTVSKRFLWNKCDVCGKIIAYSAFLTGAALRRMDSPDSDVSSEHFTTLCAAHHNERKEAVRASKDKWIKNV